MLQRGKSKSEEHERVDLVVSKGVVHKYNERFSSKYVQFILDYVP